MKQQFQLSRILLEPLIGQSEVPKLLRSVALRQWKVLTSNLIFTLIQALTEGLTLAMVYYSIEILTAKPSTVYPTPLRLLNHLFKVPSISASTHLFITFLIIALCLQLIQSASRYISDVAIGYFAASTKVTVLQKIYNQITNLSFACASNYKIGDLIDNCANGPEAIRTQVEYSSQLFTGIIMCITYIVVLTKLSASLLICAAFLAIALSFVQKRLVPKITAYSTKLSNLQLELTSSIAENLQSLRLLHSMGTLSDSRKALSLSLESIESVLRSRTRRMSLLNPISTLLPILTITILAFFTVVFIGNNQSILAGLVTFMLALQRLSAHLSGIGGIVDELADNSGKLNRLNSLLDAHDKEYIREGGITNFTFKETIAFSRVKFRYHGNKNMIINDFNLQILKGQSVAFIGSSGSGKSTIVDLLTGLYSPTSGTILVDNHDLQSLNLVAWQRKLGVVSQDSILLNRTIAQNIAYISQAASMNDVIEAAYKAQAHKFIKKLPNGYMTVVGERGYQLSGGQRQRIALARALFSNPEVLILDEATSALDINTERLVQTALENLHGNCTIIVVAHRLTTVTTCDKICVINKGSAIEVGTHETLLRSKGEYFRLWSLQS